MSDVKDHFLKVNASIIQVGKNTKGIFKGKIKDMINNLTCKSKRKTKVINTILSEQVQNINEISQNEAKSIYIYIKHIQIAQFPDLVQALQQKWGGEDSFYGPNYPLIVK